MEIQFDDLDNLFQTTLDADLTDSATTVFLVDLPVNTGEGFLAIDADDKTKIEFIHFNAKGAGFVSVPAVGGRGQGGTVAQEHSAGAVVRMYVMREHIKPLLDKVLNMASLLNPIGTIREFNVATNPETLLGFGTWAEYGKGKVTVAINSADTEFDTLEETGGAKAVTLTSAQSGLKAHGHTASSNLVSHSIGTGYTHTIGSTAHNFANMLSPTITVNNNAASDATSSHTNLQPYIVVYRWVRTA